MNFFFFINFFYFQIKYTIDFYIKQISEFKNIKILFDFSQKNKINSIFKKKTSFMIEYEKKKRFNKIISIYTHVLLINLERNELRNYVN